MGQRTYAELCALVRERTGIRLPAGKESLVLGRIQRHARELGAETAEQYLEAIKVSEEVHLERFLDAMTTNHTAFFREPEHFVRLAEMARAYRGDGPMRVWCAASSTGEEPWTLAMVLHDVLGSGRFKILATDISQRALEEARSARYRRDRTLAVPPQYRQRYLLRTADPEEVEIAPELQEHVQYATLNLALPPFPLRGNLDVISCRNVMIYFDLDVRRPLVGEIARLLRPGGTLFIGHSETLHGVKTDLEIERPSIYRKPKAKCAS